MIRNRVCFSGLEILDPSRLVEPRPIKGVIPLDWHRTRFPVPAEVSYPVAKLNRWLADNIDGRWAIYMHFSGDEREVVIAFERDYDGVAFVLANGKTEAFTGH
jgi:hypothetical protein